MKHIRYAVEAIVLYTLYGFFSLLSPATASNIGGFIGRTIGPKLAASRKARANVRLAFPDIQDDECEKIITEMWDNLGRVIAEYPHLEEISSKRTNVLNKEIIQKAVDAGNGGMLIAAHLGNWEIDIPAFLMQFGVSANLTYRIPNNPMSARLLEKSRTLDGRIKVFPKVRSSARDLMSALRDKEFIGMLVDQKYNEGVAVPFFGVPAMTNPVFVNLCQKFKCPLIAVQNRRTGPAQFELVAYEPIALFSEDGNPLPVETVIQSVHTLMENWIRETPGQWLWLHRRWDSKNLN